MSNEGNLPYTAIRKIMQHVSFKDILSLRLTSRCFCQSTEARWFYERIKITPKGQGRIFIRIFRRFSRLMKEYGKFMSVNATKLHFNQIQTLKNELSSLSKLYIHSTQLNDFAINLEKVKTLCILYDENGVEANYESLKSLSNLENLTLVGYQEPIFFEKYFPLAAVIHSLINAKNITKISFHYIFLNSREVCNLQNAVHLKHCEFQHFICNDKMALPSSLISLKCYNAQFRGIKINDKPSMEALVLSRVNSTMFVDTFSYNFNNLKYLELCYIPLCNYFESSWLLFPNLKVLKLHNTCQTFDFLAGKGSELSLSLEMLVLNSINDVKDDKELGVVLSNLESLK